MTSPAIVQYACFNTILEIVCAAHELILFESARYGRNDSAGAPACDVPLTRACDVDVQYPLSRQCGGRRKCSLAVNTAFFGDPCGYEEFLTVTFRCVQESSIQRRCPGPASPPAPHTTHGYLASPNYPGKYYMDVECEWRLRAQRGQTLRLTLYDFELDVKRGGRCHDYLAVTSRNTTLFRECGALGKQVIEVDTSAAVISFRTGQTSLTQRGFILYHEAVGVGCVELHVNPHVLVTYFLADNDVLHLNATCAEGYYFATDPDEPIREIVCSGSAWSRAVPSCLVDVTMPHTTSDFLPSGSWSSTSLSLMDHSASAMGIVFGAVFTMLLLILGILLVVFCSHRCRGRRKQDQWRMVVNNLQPCAASDVTKCLRQDQTCLELMTSSDAAAKRHSECGRRACRQGDARCQQERNLLEEQSGPLWDEELDRCHAVYCQLQHAWITPETRRENRLHTLPVSVGARNTYAVPMAVTCRSVDHSRRDDRDTKPDLIVGRARSCRGPDCEGVGQFSEAGWEELEDEGGRGVQGGRGMERGQVEEGGPARCALCFGAREPLQTYFAERGECSLSGRELYGSAPSSLASPPTPKSFVL